MNFRYSKNINAIGHISIIGLILISNIVFGNHNNSHAPDSTINYTSAISAQWIGLVFHPKGGTYPQRYIRKLDHKAYFVIEHGAVLIFEHRLFERGYFKGGAALNLDCANVLAGFLHLGLHYQILDRNRHTLSAGLGPTLVFREDWHQFPEYISDEFFQERVHGNWQYRFVFFGNIEYSYLISKKILITTSLIPAGHLLMTFTFGIKYVLKY